MRIRVSREASTVITAPTITLEAPHPDPAAYAKKFTGRYEYRTINGGIGHNLPQEAPREFAKALTAVDAMAKL